MMPPVDPLIPVQLQIFAAAILLAFIGWLLVLVRRDRLSLRDSLLWLLSTAIALVFTVFPATLRWVAQALHVEVPANALFALAFVYVLVNLVSLTIGLSNASSRVRRLTQECALLRAELERLRVWTDADAASVRRAP
jgi:hypothetical protein